MKISTSFGKCSLRDEFLSNHPVDGYQAMVLKANARDDYRKLRENGSQTDDPCEPFPNDGVYTWIEGVVKGKSVYGIQRNGHFCYSITYTPGPRDKVWESKKDANYLRNIDHKGLLKQLEPLIWYMWNEFRMQHPKNNADIGEWYKSISLSPNANEIFANAGKNLTPKFLLLFEQKVNLYNQKIIDLEAKKARVLETIHECDRLRKLIETNFWHFLSEDEKCELHEFTFCIALEDDDIDIDMAIIENREQYLSDLLGKAKYLSAENEKMRIESMRDKLQAVIEENKSLLLMVQNSSTNQLLSPKEQKDLKECKNFGETLNIGALNECGLNGAMETAEEQRQVLSELLGKIQLEEDTRVIPDSQICTAAANTSKKDNVSSAALVSLCWTERKEEQATVVTPVKTLAQQEDKKIVPKIPEPYICPLTLEIMKDPVITTDGVTFEKTAITEWLNMHDECPVTGKSLKTSELVPNRALRDLIEEFLSANSVTHATSSSLGLH